LRLLQVPLAGTDGIDVSSLPRGVILCNAYGHEPALGEFAIMMMVDLTSECEFSSLPQLKRERLSRANLRNRIYKRVGVACVLGGVGQIE